VRPEKGKCQVRIDISGQGRSLFFRATRETRVAKKGHALKINCPLISGT